MALRLGRVDAAIEVWGRCLDHHRGEESLERVADLHRKLGTALAVKGERKAAIENYQRGINLLKDGPPGSSLCACTRRPRGCTCRRATTCSPSTRPKRRCAWRNAWARPALPAAPMDFRAGVRTHRRHREGAVEPGAIGGACTRRGHRGSRSLPCWHWAATSSFPRLTHKQRQTPTRKAWNLPNRSETCRARSSCTPPSPRSPPTERTGIKCSDPPTPARVGRARRYRLEARGSSRAAGPAAVARRAARGGRASFREAQALADQVGWSELSFQALYGLSLVLRDRDAHLDAVTTLQQALDVCERAGLAAQSVQATAGQAVVLALAGREAGPERSPPRRRVWRSSSVPIVQAASLEAGGTTALDPGEGAATLAEARTAWTRLGRPLEASLRRAGGLAAAGGRP